jgi:predicted glycosyltransferase
LLAMCLGIYEKLHTAIYFFAATLDLAPSKLPNHSISAQAEHRLLIRVIDEWHRMGKIIVNWQRHLLRRQRKIRNLLLSFSAANLTLTYYSPLFSRRVKYL